MKNKIAERAKRKRRQEKQAAEQALARELSEEINQKAKANGINKRFTQKEIMRIHRQTEREMIRNSIRDDVIILAYVLHKFHGWGTVRLTRYLAYAHKYIKVVGNDMRGIPAMEYDLKADTGIECDCLFGEYEPCKGKPHTVETERKKLFLTHTKYVLPMILYMMYYDFGWKHKRMERLANEFKQAVIAAIEFDSLEKMQAELLQKCGIRVTEDGTVYVRE